jgi:hypothetical protein
LKLDYFSNIQKIGKIFPHPEVSYYTLKLSIKYESGRRASPQLDYSIATLINILRK